MSFRVDEVFEMALFEPVVDELAEIENFQIDFDAEAEADEGDDISGLYENFDSITLSMDVSSTDGSSCLTPSLQNLVDDYDTVILEQMSGDGDASVASCREDATSVSSLSEEGFTDVESEYSPSPTKPKAKTKAYKSKPKSMKPSIEKKTKLSPHNAPNKKTDLSTGVYQIMLVNACKGHRTSNFAMPKPNELLNKLSKAYTDNGLYVLHSNEYAYFQGLLNDLAKMSVALNEIRRCGRDKRNLDAFYTQEMNKISPHHKAVEHKKGRLHILPAIFFMFFACVCYHDEVKRAKMVLSVAQVEARHPKQFEQANETEKPLLVNSCNVMRCLLHLLPSDGYTDVFLLVMACAEGDGRRFSRSGNNPTAATTFRRDMLKDESNAFVYLW